MHKKIEKYIKNADKAIAFVLGADATSVGVIRSLGRRGIPVVALDPNFMAIGLFSRYCRGTVCPDPEQSEEEYIDFLLSLGEQLNSKGVMIPSNDVDVWAISKHRAKLERYYLFPMAKFDVIEKLANKKLFYQTLEKLDMPRPKTYFPSDISDVKRISGEIAYPSIIKPVFSTKFGREFGAKVLKANSAEELVKAYDKAVSRGYEAVIQEVIPGGEGNIYGFCSYFNSECEPVGIFIYKKIRGYPKSFGICSLVESAFEPEIVELGTQLLRNVNYYGISEVEFKKDPRDNIFKIIEVNTRTWGENSLAARCGVDLAYMAYMDAIGKNAEKVISEKEGVKWLYEFQDIRSCFASILKGELSFIEWVNSLRGEREYAIFAWNDPIPSLVYPFNLSRSAWERFVRGVMSTIKR